MNPLDSESRDAIRYSWTTWPSTRLDASKFVVPMASMYQPLKQLENLCLVPYDPIRCKGQSCNAVLNPFCRVEFNSKLWICPMCLTHNHFPPHYADISPDNLPAELIGDCTTMEYVLQQPMAPPVTFLFVVDVAIIDEELQQIKDSICQSLMFLPQNAYVGLITYGKNVNVHVLGFPDCVRSHVLNGNKDYSAQLVSDLLGLGAQEQKLNDPALRYLMPISECEAVLTSILEDLTRDPWTIPADQRAATCTGAAYAVAIGLLEAICKQCPARIISFVGSACSVGPGQVVGLKLEETIRSHNDLLKGNAPHYTNAVKYYEGLAKRALENGHIVDLFACSLDQIGTAEMKILIEKTGGFIVVHDTFVHQVFTQSYIKIFSRDAQDQLLMAFSGELEVITSREVKVQGAIGPCSSLEKKAPHVSEKELGIGNTCAWALGGVDPSTTLSFFFDVTAQQASQVQEGKCAYLQFVTRYKHSSGVTRLRVTTVAVLLVDASTQQGLAYVKAGFDQEAAAVIMARWAVFKGETEFSVDTLRWVDRCLIRLVSKCAEYQKENVQSFRLPNEFAFYPQFIFYLRRSQLLQVFNSSPDETAYYRMILNRETVTNALIMIQPTLMAYSLEAPIQPVMLDASSVAPTRILLMDTFLHVVVFYGEGIAKWRNDKVQDRPEYEYFADFLKTPIADAEAIVNSRFPVPCFVECDQGKSASRWIMAKLNPSITHNNAQGYGDQQPLIFTDDVPLKVFIEHLKKYAVAPQ